jgi:hypothetical protein
MIITRKVSERFYIWLIRSSLQLVKIPADYLKGLSSHPRSNIADEIKLWTKEGNIF